MIKIKDIVDTALESDSFRTLCKAVVAAGLVETLKGKGPFTVFAPINEAFAKHSTEELDALLKDKKKLTSILTYHVVPGKLMLSDFKRPKTVKTNTGSGNQDRWFTMAYPQIREDKRRKTVKTDIEVTNGVIHSIDSVLMPK